jgi:hypothetical protein
VTKPDELREDARDSYDMWRRLGLSEQAAMNALIEDGLIPLSEEDRLARNLQSIFRLNEDQARRAAAGRVGGSSSRPVSEAPSLASLKTDPSNIRHVVAAIEEIASGLCREGAAEDRALREAAVKVMLKVPDDRTADWVARVAHRFWPSIYSDSPGSSGTVQG